MKKVLIVDDEFIVRMGIRSILNWEEHGYTIVGEAKDGETALGLIRTLAPDIVLTDLVMENMDGLELIRQCRKQFPQVRFVVLSNYNDFENVKTAMKLGASDYIFKMTTRMEEILKIMDEVSASIDTDGLSMDALVQRNRQAIKKSVFFKCASRSYGDEKDLQAEFDALQLDVDLLQPYFLLYFVIYPRNVEDIRMLEQEKDNLLIAFAMGNMADELLKEKWRTETFEMDARTVVSVVHPVSAPPYAEDREMLQEKCRVFREYCRRYLNLTVYGILSDVGIGYGQLKELHLRCMEAKNAYNGEDLCVTCGSYRPEISRVMQYVDSHLGEQLSIGKAAQIACMSENYFSSVFKREVGISFIDYVNQVRMQKAAELLRQKNRKIYEVSQEVGMENPNYFSALFKKVMGVSPNFYRNEYSEP